MFTYITTALVELFSGLIGLSDDQAACRSGKLKPVDDQDGVYEILDRVQFKAGEVIGLEDPAKVILSRVEPTPETVEALAGMEEERIQQLADEKAQKILDEKFMEDVVLAAGQAIGKELVTESGAPRVDALVDILGKDVTADQRDAAWEILKAEAGE